MESNGLSSTSLRDQPHSVQENCCCMHSVWGSLAPKSNKYSGFDYSSVQKYPVICKKVLLIIFFHKVFQCNYMRNIYYTTHDINLYTHTSPRWSLNEFCHRKRGTTKNSGNTNSNIWQFKWEFCSILVKKNVFQLTDNWFAQGKLRHNTANTSHGPLYQECTIFA